MLTMFMKMKASLKNFYQETTVKYEITFNKNKTEIVESRNIITNVE